MPRGKRRDDEDGEVSVDELATEDLQSLRDMIDKMLTNKKEEQTAAEDNPGNPQKEDPRLIYKGSEVRKLDGKEYECPKHTDIIHKWKLTHNITKPGDHLIFDSEEEAQEWIRMVGREFPLEKIPGTMGKTELRTGMLTYRTVPAWIPCRELPESSELGRNPAG